MTPQSQGHSNMQSLATMGLALIGPFALVALSAWVAAHSPSLRHPAFLLAVIAIATGLGGFLFSKSTKRWPTIEGLIYLYWIALPISLIAATFIFYVRISGNGP
nr:hypothetical protein [uncultured Holophaga sp.]